SQEFEDIVAFIDESSVSARPSMSVCQTVVPSGYRSQILSLVHEHALSVLGINQTYQRVLWPGLKTVVAKFCHSCHHVNLRESPIIPFPQPHSVLFWSWHIPLNA